MPTPIRITDPDDPRIAAFRQVKERDLVGRAGRFIAEGEVVLRVLLASTLTRPVAILIDERRAEKLDPILAQAPETPLYLASQTVIDAIAGFHLHRGILALAEPVHRPSARALLDSLPDEALVVGLMGIANHDNMGGIFRNAAAFGADAVLLAPDCCDPFYRKAIRVSVGAALITPFARLDEGEDMMGLFRSPHYRVLALTPAGPRSLTEFRRQGRTAILFGAEGEGLPADILTRAEGVRIDMSGQMDSLNVATSSGIVLHALSRRWVGV